MNYNNFAPNPNQMYPQYGYSQYSQYSQQSNQNSIIWVQGEAGAKSYLIAPNTSVALWDSEANCIYIKSSDASGMPSIKTLDYTVRDNTSTSPKIDPQNNFATKDDISHLEKEINALKAKYGAKEGKKNA